MYETLRGRLHHLDLPLFEYASPTLPEWDAVLELIAVGRDLPADARLVRVATPVRS